MAKSQRSAMKRGELGGAAQPALGLDEVLLPRGGSPRSAKMFSIPASAIRSSDRREALARLADAAQVGHRLEPYWSRIAFVVSTVPSRVAPPAP